METIESIKQEYAVQGMTCGGCVSTVKEVLQQIDGVNNVDVQLEYPQVKVESAEPLDLNKVNSLLQRQGKYTISNDKGEAKTLAAFPPIGKKKEPLPDISISTYKPLILIVSFIAGTSLLVQFPFDHFSPVLWMRHFMAGFFLVFSFFKLLNLKGFANSYRMYDIVAGKWHFWGYLYPFVELGLGISYLINLSSFWTNLSTVIILGVSSIGVIQSNLNKQKIKCACLGDVFNLPMSTVTIIEDLTMVAMAGWMLIF